jgi:uncharacterized protein
LAVCDPDSDPAEVCDYFVYSLELKHFDIIIPDATHEDDPPSVARYFISLYELWRKSYKDLGVHIRYLDATLSSLQGVKEYDAIGFGPIRHAVLLTDGAMEPLDVLRIAGDSSTKTDSNILTDEIQDLTHDPLWQEIYRASVILPDQCQSCSFKRACGGGHIASRWSKARRWDNPSVYCEDLKLYLGHVQRTLSRGPRGE